MIIYQERAKVIQVNQHKTYMCAIHDVVVNASLDKPQEIQECNHEDQYLTILMNIIIRRWPENKYTPAGLIQHFWNSRDEH